MKYGHKLNNLFVYPSSVCATCGFIEQHISQYMHAQIHFPVQYISRKNPQIFSAKHSHTMSTSSPCHCCAAGWHQCSPSVENLEHTCWRICTWYKTRSSIMMLMAEVQPSRAQSRFNAKNRCKISTKSKRWNDTHQQLYSKRLPEKHCNRQNIRCKTKYKGGNNTLAPASKRGTERPSLKITQDMRTTNAHEKKAQSKPAHK